MPIGVYKRTREHNLANSLSKVGLKRDPEARRNISIAHLGLKQTQEQIRKRVESYKGQRHWDWKGDDAGYRAKHIWIERRLGKPRYCEHCKRSDLPHRSYHWANISKSYKRVVKDWIRLCVRCHKKYDS